MKISVITPSYNQARFVRGCIDSVKNQKGKFDLEHIILDNCSTDGTREILSNYQRNPGNNTVNIIIEKDEGQTQAINRGFELATGDIVCWLNTDEWYTRGALNRVADFFDSKPETDLCYGDCDFYDVTRRLIQRRKGFPFSRSMLLYYGCYIPSCSAFVSRRVVDDGILLNPDLKVTMDYEWYVRIADAGYKIGYLPETLACFTWHDNNISSTLKEKRKCERFWIQTRYSTIVAPRAFLRTAFQGFRLYWKAARFVARFPWVPDFLKSQIGVPVHPSRGSV